MCRDGHLASDRVLYIHPEPFIYVYVDACFWHRTEENFEHLPCGPSRVLELQWRGQMDQILLLHSLQFTQWWGTKSKRDRELVREISLLKWRKRTCISKKELRCLKVEKIKNRNYQELCQHHPVNEGETEIDCAMTIFTMRKIKLNDSLFKNELLLFSLFIFRMCWKLTACVKEEWWLLHFATSSNSVNS